MRHVHPVWPWLMVSAVIAVLIGAGTSFAPLYLDDWGGDARHYPCPMVGGRSAADHAFDAGLCVTPLAWYALVTVLCLLMACWLGMFCEMAVRFAAAGGVRGDGSMSRSARRARTSALLSLIPYAIIGLALGVLTGAVWLPPVLCAVVMAIWLQAAWHVCDRIGISLATRTANDTLAAAWGFGVALMTHALVCYHVTVRGGVLGAVLSACCSWAIAATGKEVDAAGERGPAARRIATARGVIAFIVQWLMAYNTVRSLEESSSVAQRTGARLCPMFVTDDSGVRIASCSADGLVPLLSSAGLIVAVAALPIGACAAMACHFGRWMLARVLYAVAGLCMASAFVIGVTLA